MNLGKTTSSEQARVFLDMDGTLCEFLEVDFEDLYIRGHFRNLKPHTNILEAAKLLIKRGYDVYIMSSVLSDSKYALSEKNEWLDEHLPEVKKENRIFPRYGSAKQDAVPGGIKETDILIDDYGKNIVSWGGQAIKVSRNFFDSVEESKRYVTISPDDGVEDIILTLEGGKNDYSIVV